MSPNSRKAFAELDANGISVMEWGEKEGYGSQTQFVLIHASRDGTQKYADDTGKWIKESWVNGQWTNPRGIRQDIHEVLSKYNLTHEWQNRGQICIYEAEPVDTHPSLKPKYRNTKADQPPDMSTAALKAFQDLARMGAPVWDFYSYRSTYDPSTLPAGTQFVMTCEPAYGVSFAELGDLKFSDYRQSEGLRPDVHAIVKKFGLEFFPHIHRYSDPIFNPLELVAFIDPAAPPR